MTHHTVSWLPWRRGPRDPIAEQLNDLERQGAGMAGLAHLAAFALVMVFSAGSLVALSGEALAALLLSAERGALDVPAAISIAVSTLLVIAMDVALVYAAASVRLLRLRRAGGVGWHVSVIVGVSAVEAATYLYMSAVYDRPGSWAVWALICARAVSAPLVAVYLSLARTLPVSARDIIASVELATGRGVVRDMTTIAADPSAPLERKLSLYSASSVMTPADSERLAALIATERATRSPETPQDGAGAAQLGLPSAAGSLPIEAAGDLRVALPDGQEMSVVDEADRLPTSPGDHPPTGGGSPTALLRASRPTAQAAIRLISEPGVRTPRRRGLGGSTNGATANAREGVRTTRRTPLRTTASRESDARAAWANGARTVGAMMTATGMSRNAAAGWVRALKGEGSALVTAHDADRKTELAR